MKFKEYIAQCLQVLKEHPEAAEFEVVSSSDDEGNSFGPVFYSPTLGYYKDHEFHDAESKKDMDVSEPNNAVCIN